MPGIGHNNSINPANLTKDARDKIKKAILEINDSLTRIASERDFQKEALEKLEDEFGVDKKKIRKMARAYFNANFNIIKEENQEFEEAYQLIINGSVETND